jgi:hypothetical protein
VHNQETCFDCGKLSPPTNTETTLTTSFGWRMVRRPNDRGSLTSEWRCPECWARFKVFRNLTTPPPEPSALLRKKT